jgi:hypothetical protein
VADVPSGLSLTPLRETITIKPKTKEHFRTVAMLSFNILQKDCVFFEDLLPYIIQTPNLLFTPSHKFVLTRDCLYEIKKSGVGVTSSGITFKLSFVKIGQLVKKNSNGGHTNIHTHKISVFP